MIGNKKDLMNNEDKNILDNLKFYEPEFIKRKIIF